MVFGSVFENRIDLEIIEICFIYQMPIMFKAARTPTLLKAGTTLSARAVPSAPLFSTALLINALVTNISPFMKQWLLSL